MILVEISDQNPLFFTDRVIVLMKGGAVRPGLLNHNKKTHLYRTRYRNGSYKTVLPTDGIFWPLFPDWYYDLEIMDHLQDIKQRLYQCQINIDHMKMFYDIVLHRLIHMDTRQMNNEQLQSVWDTYGKRMCEHKQNCDWVDRILEEGWNSYTTYNTSYLASDRQM